MSTPAAASEQPRNCIGCRQRKVRCDRRQPCSSCLERNRECVFPTSGRALRRPDPKLGARRQGSPGKALLAERIRRLERVVDQLATELEPGQRPPPPHPLPPAPPPHNPSEERESSNLDQTGRMLSLLMTSLQASVQAASNHDSSGQSSRPLPRTGEQGMMVPENHGKIYVGDYFWATLQWEWRDMKVKVIREHLEELEVDDETDPEPEEGLRLLPSPPTNSPTYPLSSFIFCNAGRGGATLEDLRLLPSQTLFTWHTFVERFDPFVKVLHVPTVYKTIQEAGGNFARMDQAMESLMFSISLAALGSLSDEEARVNFNTPRDELVRRFQLGTEEALARANFTSTTSLAVVQAFTIYLHATLQCTPIRLTWSLVGLLVRIAVSLGLHRDGSAFPGISLFETEMRRRVWWHVCFLDFFAGDRQVAEMSMHPGLFDTNPPTNVDDEDIDPDMTDPPSPKDGYTDVAFCLVQREAWLSMKAVKTAMAKLSPDSPESDWRALKSTLVFDLKDRVGPYILQGPQLPCKPVQAMLPRMLNIVQKRYQLLLSYPPQACWLQANVQPPNDEPFTLALSILNEINDIKLDPSLHKWCWKMRGFAEWQALAVVLSRICIAHWDETAESSWMSVTKYISLLPAVTREEPLWKPLSKLLWRVWKNRAHHLHGRDQAGTSPEPPRTDESASGTTNASFAANSSTGTDPNAETPSTQSLQNQNLLGGSIVSGEDVDMVANLPYPLQLLNWDEWSEAFRMDRPSIL